MKGENMADNTIPEYAELYQKVLAVFMAHHHGKGRNPERLKDLWEAVRIDTQVLTLLLGNCAAAPVSDAEAQDCFAQIVNNLRQRTLAVRQYNSAHSTPVKWEH